LIDLAALSKLVASIYETNLDAKQWATLAGRIAGAFSAESGSLQLQGLGAGGATDFLSITDNITDIARASYEQYYFQRDVYVQHAIKHGLNNAYLSQHAVSPSDVAQSEFYTDWGKRTGIFHVVGGGATVGSASVALLAVHRPLSAPMFDEPERELLAMLLPHIGRALQVARQMGGLRATDKARSAALDRLTIATIVVAADGTVLSSNAAADRLFQAADAIQSVNGRLRSRRQPDILSRMIHSCAFPTVSVKAPGGMLTLPRPQRLPLSLLVGPLNATYPAIGHERPAAIIFAHDPEIAEQTDEAALCALYNLTGAEARLAAALAAGERLQAFADRRGISLATVKTQLRQVLAKTGTGRQADLVANLTRNSILRMASPFR